MTKKTMEALEIELISLIGSDHMNRGLTLRAASHQAAKLVESYRAAVLASYTPATGGMPETPKLAPGDGLIVVNFKTRYRPEFVQGAEVLAMARYRVTLRWTSLESGRVETEDFDVRTRCVWHNNRSDRLHRGGGSQFFTDDQWAWEQRARLADAYLKERGVYPSSVRGPLSPLLSNDRVGFANALRRLEGLVEL